MTLTIATRVLALLVLVCLTPSSAPAQPVAGQAPMLLVGDQFQFTPGTWATYILHDKRGDTYSTLTMSVLESVRNRGQDSAWIELKVETAAELVVTRILARKTPSGPGEVFEAIVYVHGLQPFRIPQRWLKGDEQEVGKASRAVITARAAPRQMTFDGRTLDVIDVDATDDTGGTVAATVSAGVAPMGILTVDSTEIGMYLEDWGTGATTGVVGKPVSFVEWTATMVARGISGKDVALPAKPRRSIDTAGVWEEVDGPCVGSEWTFTNTSPGATKQTWRLDRVLTFEFAGTERGAGQMLVAFTAPTRAVLVFVTPAGRRTIATLVNRQRRQEGFTRDVEPWRGTGLLPPSAAAVDGESHGNERASQRHPQLSRFRDSLHPRRPGNAGPQPRWSLHVYMPSCDGCDYRFIATSTYGFAQ